MTGTNGTVSHLEIPPQALDAEQAVIGCCLLSRLPDTMRDVLEIVSADDFYGHHNRIIFRTICRMREAGDVVDAVTLGTRLGGEFVIPIGRCVEIDPNAAHAVYYAEIVRKYAAHRQYIESLQRKIADAYDINKPIEGEPRKGEPRPIDIWDLSERHRKLRPPIIDGLLRQGETMGIHAKSKVGKSWTAYGLGLSIITGAKWLERFRCSPGNVLLIDNELHEDSLADRIPRTVADAMQVTRDQCRGKMDVLSLRGQLRDVYGLREQFDRITQGFYSLIIIDAFYRILPPGISENDNAAMAEVFNAIDTYAMKTGAAFVLIHHASKGDQSGKDVVDVGSGAGSISRAVDAHLVLRPHEEPDHIVLDAALRSFAPIEPIVLQWCFPLWVTTEGLDPKALKGRKPKSQEVQQERDQEGTIQILAAIRKHPSTPKQLRQETGISKARLDRLLDILQANKEIIGKELKVRGQLTREYSLSHSVDSLGHSVDW
jgi:hypothetical protein